METEGLLCDSNICRLCGEVNKNGASLFPVDESEQDLSQLVNKYLPLKVENNGKYPTVICPGCNIQLEATKQFLDLIVEGQTKLRGLYRQQQETIRRQEKQRQQLDSALKDVNPNSSVKTYSIQTDESGEKFVIQIFSEGPLFPSDHELSLRAEGLERPRRKRGRPPKPPPPSEEELQALEAAEASKVDIEAEEDDNDGEGRRRRKIKVPSRFQEVVQGKELERIFKEEGVLDEDSTSDVEHSIDSIRPFKSRGDEVIGHLRSKDGEDLEELVVVNRDTKKLFVKLKNGSDKSSKNKKYECELCGKWFSHLGRYEMHKILHNNTKYKCDNQGCHVEDKDKTVVEKHQQETGHSGIALIRVIDNTQNVSEQNQTSATETNLVNILEEPKRQHLKDLYCDICSKTFSTKQNYDIHFKAIHEQRRPYKCDKCNKTFPYINSFKCHMMQHSDKNDKAYVCEVCKKVFNHPSSLVYHREAEHNNGRRFVCNKCNKTFKHKQLLQRHQLVHSEERPHVCKICSASFKTKANLLNHTPVHTGERKYCCIECGQSFAHKTSLTLHTRWHNGQKPYQCDVCLKMFSQKGNLQEHKRIHTGEKPFCCDHCGRKFTTSSQFRLHLKRHTGERPWRCEYCSKTFLHKDTWKCHTRRHRNERPYQCQECFRGFTEQWALKKHERLHTGEKPYVCEVCNKSFADCSNLTKHRKIHWNADKAREDKDLKMISAAGEGSDQVVYLAYQDSNSNDSQLQTFVHIMDPGETGSSENVTETVTNDTFLSSAPLQDSLSNFHGLQQIIDEDGSVLGLTAINGQQIKVVTALEEGNESMQGLLPTGTLVPLSLAIQDGKTSVSDVLNSSSQDKSPNSSEAVVINNHDAQLNSTSDKEILEDNQTLLHENQKLENIQFLTEDGQNICLITAYNGDESIINSQYLAMA